MISKRPIVKEINPLNNILRAALGTAIPSANIDAILQVINATANPIVAAEVLLGCYQEPSFLPNADFNDSNRINSTFIEYNIFTDEVKYSYNRITRKKGWFKNDEPSIMENLLFESTSWSKVEAAQKADPDFEKKHKLLVYEETVSETLEFIACSSHEWVKRQYELLSSPGQGRSIDIYAEM